MPDTTEILWRMYQEHCTQGRHHESQRSAMTTLVVSVAGAAIGIITYDKQIDFEDLPLAFLVLVIGAFGALFRAKHYERFSMHMERARGYRDRLEELLPDTRLREIKQRADERSRAASPRLFGLRLFGFWVTLHLIVAIMGGILLLICLCKK
jgi:hypothetical protein